MHGRCVNHPIWRQKKQANWAFSIREETSIFVSPHSISSTTTVMYYASVEQPAYTTGTIHVHVKIIRPWRPRAGGQHHQNVDYVHIVSKVALFLPFLHANNRVMCDNNGNHVMCISRAGLKYLKRLQVRLIINSLLNTWVCALLHAVHTSSMWRMHSLPNPVFHHFMFAENNT